MRKIFFLFILLLVGQVYGQRVPYQNAIPVSPGVYKGGATLQECSDWLASSVNDLSMAGATLSAPDIGLDIVVDDLTGTLEAGGSGYSAAWVGSNPE